MPNRGVYFLANDAIFDITIAFLNSFRLSNPLIDLCLIPFDDNISRIADLSGTYNFSIFHDNKLLKKCDVISTSFFSSSRGHFRKLCSFHGPFDEFIYIDCDTVVLHDVTFAFQFLNSFDIVFSHSDFPRLRRWVWKDSIYQANALTAEQIAFSANTGFYCSRSQSIDVHKALRNITKAAQLAPHMELMCVEQPYLNYLAVSSGLRYTSLLTLKRLFPKWKIPLERWAGSGLFSLNRDSVKHRSRDFMLYHWAGCWAATGFDRALYDFANWLGYQVRSPTVRLFMPRRRLWRRFRYHDFANPSPLLQSLAARPGGVSRAIKPDECRGDQF